jgi:hypothetical protein
MAALGARLRELASKLGQNSTNSHLPPSSDSPRMALARAHTPSDAPVRFSQPSRPATRNGTGRLVLLAIVVPFAGVGAMAGFFALRGYRVFPWQSSAGPDVAPPASVHHRARRQAEPPREEPPPSPPLDPEPDEPDEPDEPAPAPARPHRRRPSLPPHRRATRPRRARRRPRPCRCRRAAAPGARQPHPPPACPGTCPPRARASAASPRCRPAATTPSSTPSAAFRRGGSVASTASVELRSWPGWKNGRRAPVRMSSSAVQTCGESEEIDMGVFERRRRAGTVYYVSFVWNGHQVQERAGTDKRQALQLERQRKREVRGGTYRPDNKSGSTTLANYMSGWLQARRGRGVRTVADDETRLRRPGAPCPRRAADRFEVLGPQARRRRIVAPRLPARAQYQPAKHHHGRQPPHISVAKQHATVRSRQSHPGAKQACNAGGARLGAGSCRAAIVRVLPPR